MGIGLILFYIFILAVYAGEMSEERSNIDDGEVTFLPNWGTISLRRTGKICQA